MTKRNFKKSNAKVGNENRKNGVESKRLKKDARELIERGNTFGDFVLDLLDLFIIDWRDMGAAAIGMARAMAALKQEARNEGVPVDKFFQSELEFFEKEFADLGSEE